MKKPCGTTGVKAATVVGWFILTMLCPATAGAQSRGADAGLLTRIAGQVRYSPPGGVSSAPEAFMKLRQGDRIDVPADGSAQLVYFSSNRQETWKGPALLVIGEGSSFAAPEGSVSPTEVRMLPAGCSTGMQQVPALFRRAGLNRAGGVQLRGLPRPGELSEPASATPAVAAAEIVAAREIFQSLKAGAREDDVTPEIYLLGVLAGHERYPEMQSLLRDALRRRPDDSILERLAAWAAAQESK